MPTSILCLVTSLVSWFPLAAPNPDTNKEWAVLREGKSELTARIQAAQSIAHAAQVSGECGKFASEFIELGLKHQTPASLRDALAKCIAECDSEIARKLVAARMGPGQLFEQLFLLRAAAGLADEGVDFAVATRMLEQGDVRVRAAAVDVLARHRARKAVPELEAALQAQKDLDLVPAIVATISAIEANTDGWMAWHARLEEFAKSRVDALRNAALNELAKEPDPSRTELFVGLLTHSDWSTRAIAIEWLTRARTKPALGALVPQLVAERNGTRLHADVLGALESLTGLCLGDDGARWAEWWKNSAASFEFAKLAGSPRTEGLRKPPSPDPATNVVPRFYGVAVESRHIVFVIDISGSMEEPMAEQPPNLGSAESEKLTRISVARRELTKIIDDLPAGAAFNIISFSTVVNSWLEGGLAEAEGKGAGGPKSAPRTGSPDLASSGKPREEARTAKVDAVLRSKAKEWVGRLRASGGTNLFEALERAFEDPLVDTIFVLSDGQPTHGRETDPAVIRSEIKRWNTVRKIRVHTVAIGLDLEVLKALAADSGGEHRWFR